MPATCCVRTPRTAERRGTIEFCCAAAVSCSTTCRAPRSRGGDAEGGYVYARLRAWRRAASTCWPTSISSATPACCDRTPARTTRSPARCCARTRATAPCTWSMPPTMPSLLRLLLDARLDGPGCRCCWRCRPGCGCACSASARCCRRRRPRAARCWSTCAPAANHLCATASAPLLYAAVRDACPRPPAPPRPDRRRARRRGAGARRSPSAPRCPPRDVRQALRPPRLHRRHRFPPPHRHPDPAEKPHYEHDIATPPRRCRHAITGEALVARAAAVRDEVAKAFIGQAEVLDQILVALLAGGHVLIEGVPGPGQDAAGARARAGAGLQLRARAVHARPDAQRRQRPRGLRPEDRDASRSAAARCSPTCCSPTRSTARRPRRSRRCSKRCRNGRSPSKASSFALPPPFLVLATQNPIEQEGTYPLPEAQLDRFLLKILIDYPELDDEKRMVAAVSSGRSARRLRPVAACSACSAAARSSRMQLGTAAVTRGSAVHRLRGAHRRGHAQVAGHRARRRPARQHRAGARGACAGGAAGPRFRHPRRHARDRQAGAAPPHRRWRRNCRSRARRRRGAARAAAKVEAPRQ